MRANAINKELGTYAKLTADDDDDLNKNPEDWDIIGFWKSNKIHLPILSQLGLAVLREVHSIIHRCIHALVHSLFHSLF